MFTEFSPLSNELLSPGSSVRPVSQSAVLHKKANWCLLGSKTRTFLVYNVRLRPGSNCSHRITHVLLPHKIVHPLSSIHPSIHRQSSNSAGNSKFLPLMNESRAFASSGFWVEIELLAGSPMQLFRFVSISLRKLGGVTTPVGGRAICRTDSSKVERAVAPPLRLSLSLRRE